MNILVAGGLGYIGSHTMVELLNQDHKVICVDNLYNSSIVAKSRVEQITNKKIDFYNIDLINFNEINKVFSENKIDCVIMFAGYKAVGESNQKPLEYYYNNLISLINILEAMKKNNCFNIIFSSSATVYGMPNKVPIKEDDDANNINIITSPYGRTKAMIERMLTDLIASDNRFKAVILRYFNPVGAHPSTLIGEDPRGIPNNLMPYIAQVAVGKREMVHVFGNDYKTKDGTGVRDYIHVVDLAMGHVLALKCFEKNDNYFIYNLGTGIGYSVLDVINTYEKVINKKINYVIDARRPGDVDCLYCDPAKAKLELGFEAKKNLYDMCLDSYNFQNNNPNGYDDNKVIKMVFE